MSYHDDPRLAALPAAVRRMKAWADVHGECDTQGIMDDEWEALARAALGLPEEQRCSKCGAPIPYEQAVLIGACTECWVDAAYKRRRVA